MLSGNLGIFPLPDVIKVVAGRDITGRIAVRRDAVTGEFSIDRGKVVSARLTEDEAPTNYDEALDVAVVLFDGTGGTFEVHQEEWIGGPLDLDPDALASAIDERRDAWAIIIDRIGSLEDPPMLAAQLPDGTEEVILSGDQWRLVTLMDGSRTAPDIARDSSLSVFAVATALADMEKAGIVTRGVRGARGPQRGPERFVGAPGSADPPAPDAPAVPHSNPPRLPDLEPATEQELVGAGVGNGSASSGELSPKRGRFGRR